MSLQRLNCRFAALGIFIVLLFCGNLVASTCNTKIPESDRVDCHADPGATEARCRCRGCRWCETTTPSIPYCFHENEANFLAQVSLRAQCSMCSNCKERIDCHPEPGANSETCRARSCMWCPEAGNKEPWCFYGGIFMIESYRQMCPNCGSCNPVNCLPGEASPTELKCKAKGCLWCSSLSPKCTFGGSTPAPVQYRANCQSCSSCAMKYDCHPEPNASQTDCEARGCMWCVSEVQGEPWCVYHGSIAATCTNCTNCNTRIDCHPEPFATQFSCENRGCYWCPTKQSGMPYCVYPTVYV